MRFDVSEKLSAVLFLLLLSVALPWYYNLALFVLLLISRWLVPSLRPISPPSSRTFWSVLRYFILVILAMVAINGLLIQEGEELKLFDGVLFSTEGLEFGIQTGSRLLVIATTVLLFFGSTGIPRIAEFLQTAGWPVQLVMTLLLTLSFIETLPKKISMIFTAQEARGAAVRSNVFLRAKSFFLILSPLLLSSIVESIDRSMALELRGFHRATKLSFGGSPAGPRSRSAVSVILLALSILLIVWIILQWLRG